MKWTRILATLSLPAVLVGCNNEPLSLEQRAKEAQEELREAREDAAEQIAEAEQDAVDILSDARAEAEKEVANAKIEAKETVNQAERKLDEMMDMIGDKDDIAGTSPPGQEPEVPDVSSDSKSEGSIDK